MSANPVVTNSPMVPQWNRTQGITSTGLPGRILFKNNNNNNKVQHQEEGLLFSFQACLALLAGKTVVQSITDLCDNFENRFPPPFPNPFT